MSGAEFKKLMAEMRRGDMYLYFSKLPWRGLKTPGRPILPQIYGKTAEQKRDGTPPGTSVAGVDILFAIRVQSAKSGDATHG